MIALLCSVPSEAELLLKKIVVEKTPVLGSTSIIEGTLGNKQVLLCIGGIGPVNAAHAATLLLSQFHPDMLILFGIGGAYPSSGANIGDVAIATEELAGDEGVLTQDGFKNAEYIGTPLLKTAASVKYGAYAAPDALLKRVSQALHSYQESAALSVHLGIFVTVSTCTRTLAQARELEKRYHGLCENMEGAAVVQVAELHGIPWIEVRGISNIVEDRAVEKWNIPKATEAAQKSVLHIIGHLQKVKNSLNG